MKNPFPYPFRFETEADALLFMECYRNRTKFPQEKVITPFILMDGCAVKNPKYHSAPYELGLVDSDGKLIWSEQSLKESE